ncbi:hypothetical protein KCU88_g4308, partial [Aureobasidium melanogenum]
MPAGRQSTLSASTRQPKSWLPEHDAFIRRHARNGEDATSISILFETEFPGVRVTRDWIGTRMKQLGLL